jgi:hypothetical protein
MARSRKGRLRFPPNHLPKTEVYPRTPPAKTVDVHRRIRFDPQSRRADEAIAAIVVTVSFPHTLRGHRYFLG